MARQPMLFSPGTRVHVMYTVWSKDAQRYLWFEFAGDVWSYGTTSYRRWVIVDVQYQFMFRGAALQSGCVEVKTVHMHNALVCRG